MNTTLLSSNKNKFTNVAVSALGDLYGILNGPDGRSYAYSFDWVSAQWRILNSTLEIVDVKTDKIGRPYFLDKDGVVYNHLNTKIIDGVRDFEVTS